VVLPLLLVNPLLLANPLLVVLPVVGPPLADVLAPIPLLDAPPPAPLEPRLLPDAVVHFGFDVVVSSLSHATTVVMSNAAARAPTADSHRAPIPVS
jgi:hypothetical protein